MLNRNTIVIGICSLVVAIAAVSVFVRRAVQARIGPQYSFRLSNHPKYLVEEIALSKATDALTLDGFDATSWFPVRDGRTKSPAGQLDEFMARNAVNPNRAVIVFTNNLLQRRFVSVELDGNKLICQGSIPK